METYELDRKSNEALENARIIQKKISEKEFEIEMNNINSRYLYHQHKYLDDINSKYAIEMLELLKDRRDMFLSSAIFYALHIIEREINNLLGSYMSGSLSALSLIGISSFVTFQVKSFKIDSSTRKYAIKIGAQLMLKGNAYTKTREELQKILNVSYRQ